MKILYVCHRIPYPPNKGEKIRAYHLIKHLAGRHELHLFALADREEDLGHAEALSKLSHRSVVCPLNARLSRLKSLAGLWRSRPLTTAYFHSPRLAREVRAAASQTSFDVAVAYSSSMIPYVSDLGIPWVADFVDLDSQKWRQYAASSTFPLSWLYRREADLLFRFECEAAARARASVFVTSEEGELLADRAAPGTLHTVSLGVDLDYYRLDVAPDPDLTVRKGPVILFVGNMDYRPNYEGVCLFAREIFPAVRAAVPDAIFVVVGAHPHPRVRALHNGDSIIVTGRVPDPRPYLKAARLSVVPLFMARGIQTKVLEAMAMQLPVVVTPKAAEGIGAEADRDYVVAADSRALTDSVVRLLENPAAADRLGKAARRYIEDNYQWQEKTVLYERILTEAASRGASGDTLRPAVVES